MRRDRLTVLASCVACIVTVFAISGCQWLTGGGSTKFWISTQGRVLPNAGCPPSGCAGYLAYPESAVVQGHMTELGGNPVGNAYMYVGQADVSGIGGTTSLYEVDYPVVNAYW